MTKAEFEKGLHGEPISMDDWEIMKFVQEKLRMKWSEVEKRWLEYGMFWFLFQAGGVAQERISLLENQLITLYRIRRLCASFVADVINAAAEE